MARFARQMDSEPPVDSDTFTAVLDTLTVMHNPVNVGNALTFVDRLLALGYAIAPIAAVDNRIFADGYFTNPKKEAA